MSTVITSLPRVRAPRRPEPVRTRTPALREFTTRPLADLFPLPLTAFEDYMLDDDRPEYPMTFFIKLHFRGRLDQKLFKVALERVLDRHPLFRANVRELFGRRMWAPAKDRNPLLSWEDDQEPISGCGYLDLADEVGLRLWVRENNRGAAVLIQFHHACCDGVGAMQFIEDLLTAYAAAHSETGQSPAMRPLYLGRLANRGECRQGLLRRLLTAPVCMLAARGIAEFLVNRPAPLATPARPQVACVPESGGPDIHTHRFSKHQLRNLRERSEQLGATVNDLLMRDLIEAVNEWNSKHAPQQSGRCIRISMPVNLRTSDDELLPAANHVAMVFIDRRPARYTKVWGLLDSIRLDTWFIKRFRLARVFIWLMTLLRACGIGLSRWIKEDRCMATTVLSNLGVRLDDLPLPYYKERILAGDVMLDRIEFTPPVRPLTHASLGVVTYAGELSISLHHDQSMSSQAAADFLAAFAARVNATAAAARPEKPPVKANAA
ncbi:MAG: hypothetical protein HY000_35970 [Planctomycetes bacterium]|nr:hypothetical protein [Planctomycetota bacterium]